MRKEVSNWWERETSNWWYLVALFLLLGGLIAYVAVKDDNPEKASECFCIGGIITCIAFFVFLVLAWIG